MIFLHPQAFFFFFRHCVASASAENLDWALETFLPTLFPHHAPGFTICTPRHPAVFIAELMGVNITGIDSGFADHVCNVVY